MDANPRISPHLKHPPLSLRFDQVLSDRSAGDCLSLNSVQVVNGILSFTDTSHLRLVIQCLTTQLKSHEDGFEQTYPNASAEELDDIAEEIGYYDYQPLKDFESNKRFSSRRVLIENAQNTWMVTTPIIWDNDPDDWDGYDVIVRTLMTTDGKIMINGSVFQFNLVPDDEHDRGDCYSYKYDKEWLNYSKSGSIYRAKTKVSLFNGPGFTTVSGETKHYTRRNNGTYRRSNTKMHVSVGGRWYDHDCSSGSLDSKSKGYKNRNRLFSKITKWEANSRKGHKFIEMNKWAAIGQYNNGSVVVSADLD